MKLRKGEKLVSAGGEFECVINKYGGIVNAPMITVWGKEKVLDYIKFLEKLLPELE